MLKPEKERIVMAETRSRREPNGLRPRPGPASGDAPDPAAEDTADHPTPGRREYSPQEIDLCIVYVTYVVCARSGQ